MASERIRYTVASREGALRLVDEFGIMEAQRRTGIAAGTLRSWASRRALRAREVGGVDPVPYIPPVAPLVASVGEDLASGNFVSADPRDEQGEAERWARIALSAELHAEALLAKGRYRDAKDAALVGAIATDKRRLCIGEATSRRDSRVLSVTAAVDGLRSSVPAQSTSELTGRGLGIPSHTGSDLPIPAESTEVSPVQVPPADGAAG